MQLATRADLEKLLGSDAVHGLSPTQVVAAIAEARRAFAETGDRHRTAEAVRTLVDRMRR
jgi:hypothetical protein